MATWWPVGASGGGLRLKSCLLEVINAAQGIITLVMSKIFRFSTTNSFINDFETLVASLISTSGLWRSCDSTKLWIINFSGNFSATINDDIESICFSESRLFWMYLILFAVSYPQISCDKRGAVLTNERTMLDSNDQPNQTLFCQVPFSPLPQFQFEVVVVVPT